MPSPPTSPVEDFSPEADKDPIQDPSLQDDEDPTIARRSQQLLRRMNGRTVTNALQALEHELRDHQWARWQESADVESLQP